jgi:hypothetical protein
LTTVTSSWSGCAGFGLRERGKELAARYAGSRKRESVGRLL